MNVRRVISYSYVNLRQTSHILLLISVNVRIVIHQSPFSHRPQCPYLTAPPPPPPKKIAQPLFSISSGY